jgi:hypothetical protein
MTGTRSLDLGVWEIMATRMKATRPARPRVIIDSPKLLILHEKHVTWHFLVKNDEDLFRVALSVVRGRQKQGWWYGKPAEKPTNPGFTSEDVKKLPDSLRAEAQRKLRNYEQALDRWHDDNQLHLDIRKCLAENDGRLAWQILRDRSDGEYERVQIDQLSTEYDV